MPIESELPVRVYIEDTDTGGVVYHANYLRYFERARTEMLRTLGIQQRDTLAAGTAFVVYSIDLRFMRPAVVDDLLTIVSRVTSLGAASIEFEQEARRPDGEVACRAQVTIACVDRQSLRARRVPRDVYAQLVQAAEAAGGTEPA